MYTTRPTLSWTARCVHPFRSLLRTCVILILFCATGFSQNSALPDLTITSALVSPSSTNQGQTVHLTWTLTNQGAPTADYSFTALYLSKDAALDASDTIINQQFAYPIDRLKSYDYEAYLQIPAWTLPGNYYLIISGDFNNAIPESNETNNNSFLPIQINVQQIDLAISNLNVSQPAPYLAGQQITVNNTLHNFSNDYITYAYTGYFISTDNVYSTSDLQIGYTAADYLYPNGSQDQSAVVSLPTNLPGGNYFLLAVADFPGYIPEVDEINNTASLAIPLTLPDVDLVVTNATLSPTLTSAGSDIHVTNQVTNLGQSVSDGELYTGYYLSTDTILSLDSAAGTFLDIFLGSTFHGSIAAGGSVLQEANFSMPIQTTPGAYYIIARADYGEQQGETNKQNNITFLNLQITAPDIDLVITNPRLSAPEIVAGLYATILDTLNNVGTSYSPSSYTGYYLSKDLQVDSLDLYLGSTYSLEPGAGGRVGELFSQSIPTAIPPGKYFILIKADIFNMIPETNEENNMTALPVTVRNFNIDLSIQEASLSDSVLNAGGTVTVNYTVANSGSDAVGLVSTYFYLSKDDVLDTFNDSYLGSSFVNSIGANSSTNGYGFGNIPAAISEGKYYVIVVTNVGSSISETNENNNTRAIPVRIVMPQTGLKIYSLTVTPTNVVPGDTLSVSDYVVNIGTTPASNTMIGYFLSSDSIYDYNDQNLYNSISLNVVHPDSGIYISGKVTLPLYYDSLGTKYIIAVPGYQYNFPIYEGIKYAYAPITFIQQNVDLSISFPNQKDTLGIGVANYLPYVLKNSGSTKSRYNFTRFTLSKDFILDSSDIYLSEDFVYSVPAKGSSLEQAYVVIPESTIPGQYYIIAEADYNELIPEENENNNLAFTPVRVLPFTDDLVLTSASLIAGPVIAGGSQVTTYAEVSSKSNTFVDSVYFTYALSTDSLYSAADVIIGSNFLGSLGYNFNIPVFDTVQIPSSIVPGNYYLLYRVQSTLNESNYQNNVAAIKIQVGSSLPDLITEHVSVVESGEALNKYLRVKYTIKNNGASLAGPNYAGIYISSDNILDQTDLLITSKTISSIPEGSIFVQEDTLMTPIAPSGVVYIFVQADNGNQVFESNENNNTTLIKWQTENNLDSTFTHVTILQAFNPSYAEIGEKISFTADVKNTGGKTIPYTSLSVYLIPQQQGYTYKLGETTLHTALSPKEEQRITLTATIPYLDGMYYVKYVADEQLSMSGNAFTSNVFWDTIYVGSVTAIDGISGHMQLTVSPNPAQETFNITFSNNQSAPSEFTLYNQLGQEVWSHKVVDSALEKVIAVPCEQFGKGLFLLKSNIGGNVIEEKIIIQ